MEWGLGGGGGKGWVDNLIYCFWDPNQGRDHNEAQLPGGEEWRPMNRAYGEFGLGLDEIDH